MSKKRNRPEETIGTLLEAYISIGQGNTVDDSMTFGRDACRSCDLRKTNSGVNVQDGYCPIPELPFAAELPSPPVIDPGCDNAFLTIRGGGAGQPGSRKRTAGRAIMPSLPWRV
jgi:hypothetical protein